MSPGRPHVVVVGAGFGGLECAKALRGAPVDVTVVERQNFHTFTPLLYQVATSALTPADVAFPIRAVFRGARNVRVRRAVVTGIDLLGRRVCLDDGDELAYDHLVVAVGATTAWFGVEGAAEHALDLYGLSDAVRLRNHVLQQFEVADAHPERAAAMLTFVVVGGGPTGVEMAGAFVELFEGVLSRDFPNLDMARARVVVVEMGDRLLAGFSPTGSRHALEQLRARGVEVRLGETVRTVDPESVTLASGEVVPTGTVVWAAGVRASSLLDGLPLERVRNGRVVVDPSLRVPDHPEVLIVGDLAAASWRHGLLPQVANVAQQEGRHAGRTIVREVTGRPVRPFRYHHLGFMATIGRGAAVADLPGGIRLTGSVGWLAWLGLHLVRLVGVRNRISVLLNWAWNYVTWDRGPRIILQPIIEVGPEPASGDVPPRGPRSGGPTTPP
jgi:NADH:ubiquinone reductase (H+-translocating)